MHKPILLNELMDNDVYYYQSELEIIEYTYDIMFHVSSVDINQTFLVDVFEFIIDNRLEDKILDKNKKSASSLKTIDFLKKIVSL